jgi:hypothetical protein
LKTQPRFCPLCLSLAIFNKKYYILRFLPEHNGTKHGNSECH